jgi:hypothetical protein
LTVWFVLARFLALPMIGVVEGLAMWGADKVFRCWFFFVV